MRYLWLAALVLFLAACGRVNRMTAGKYQVADQEYSADNYNMERTFGADGALLERHVVDRCLLMEMAGIWTQKSGMLTLTYTRMHNRASCHDTLPEWSRDTTSLEIPVRNVEPSGFESLLAASDGRAERWLKWMRLD